MPGQISYASSPSREKPFALTDLLRIAGLASLYYLTGKLGLRLASVNPSATAIWPPAGISLAAILLLGQRMSIGVWIGAFWVNITTAGTVATSFGIATGNTMEAMVGAWLIDRLAHGPRAFERAVDIVMFVLLGALCALISATFGVTSLALGGAARFSEYGQTWLTWWCGDLVSAILIAPFLLILCNMDFPRLRRREILEGGLLAAVLILVNLWVFADLGTPELHEFSRAFMCTPVLLWAAFRFGPLGAISTAVITSAFAISAAARGAGPFVLRGPNESLLLAQVFTAAITVTNLIIGTLIEEQRRAARAIATLNTSLQARESELRAVTRITPVMLTRCSRDRVYRWVNRAYSEMLGRAPEEIIGKPIVEIMGEDGFAVVVPHIQAVLRGETVNYEAEVPFAGVGTRHLRATYMPDRGPSGQVQGWVASISDITEHMRVQAALRESDLRYGVLAETASDAIISIDEAETIIFANQATEAVLGWTPGELLGKKLAVLMSESVHSAHMAAFEHYKETGQRSTPWQALQVVGMHKTGRDVSLEISFGEFTRGGKRYFTGIIRDVTQRKRAAQVLSEQARLLDLSADAVLVRDWRDDRIIFWNQGATAMYGWSREEALGKDTRHLLQTEFPESFEAARMKLEQDDRWICELAHRRRDGSRIRVVSRWVLDRDESGNPKSILESNTDVTALRQAESAQARLASIVESSRDPIVSKTLDGVVTSWNQAAEQLFGYSAAEMVGQSILTIIPPDRAKEEAEILDCLRRGENIDRYETIRRAKDGRSIPVFLTISPIRNSVGTVIGASKIVRDLTEHKAAQRAVEESEARFRTMGDRAPVMIWIADTDKKCTWFNKPWLDFVGRSLEQELGGGWAENVHPEDLEPCLHTYVESFDAQREFKMEYRLRRHDGQWRWVLDNGIPLYAGDGAFTGYVGSCVDITQRKNMEESARRELEEMSLMHAISRRMVRGGDVQNLMNQVLETAITLMNSDYGNVQAYDETGVLKIIAYRGFKEPFLRFFSEVHPSTGACGTAMKRGERVIVEDVLTSEIFMNTSAQQVLLDADVRAVQSTPLVSGSGTFVGMISTHFRQPHRPSERELQLLDVLGRLAADVIERCRNEAELEAWQRELASRVESRTAELAAAHKELQAEIDERHRLEGEITKAIEREKLRLGQELHDGLGQELAGIGLLMASLRSKLKKAPPGVAADLDRLQGMLREGVIQTRTLAKGFYPVELEMYGLPDALMELASQTGQRTGTVCVVQSDNDRRCAALRGPPAIQLFRIAQEAVHNAIKHARAQRIEIQLATAEDHLTMTVRDDGVGLPADIAKRTGLGMKIMRYRARTVGASLDVHSGSEGGTVLSCTVSLEPRRDEIQDSRIGPDSNAEAGQPSVIGD